MCKFYFYNLDEFQNALDEIKSNERDIGMIAIVAKTLFEKFGDL